MLRTGQACTENRLAGSREQPRRDVDDRRGGSGGEESQVTRRVSVGRDSCVPPVVGTKDTML